MHGRNPLRPQELGDGQSLWVQEVFYTLQGEGPFSGQPALFVRLSGCNLNCYFCDTEFESSSWKPALGELLAEISRLRPQCCDLIVITGGEPFRQNLAPLVTALLEQNLRVQIETNGTLWVDLPESERLFIICSPKTPRLNSRLAKRITAYKYVLSQGNIGGDGLPDINALSGEKQLDAIARPMQADSEGGGQIPVYVMPLDEGDQQKNAANLKACTEAALAHGYFLTVQTHKIVGIR